ncbi:MBL fold metallo-hydrolase [Corynebacterium argentoratense]|uniref:MBL fold metallo-hydrolase n=1 Tax=Corynebacterium argentoratense TaxID=42817 RepID=UPI00248DFF59|nr:MBL fold metallo-hydrolase [Corynebacterium argentoratense]
MKLRILGCSGSVGGPNNPASGYLIHDVEGQDVLIDCGPGILAELQQVADPSSVHMLFSHLHADHCLDFPSLLVWRRYHPERPSKACTLCLGPVETTERLGGISADTYGEIDDFSDTFNFQPWQAYEPVFVDRLKVTSYPVIHPVETYAIRIECPKTGAIVAYSGDSAYTDELIDCARDADFFLCEATWGDTSEGKAPGMHLSGAEAGRIAKLAGAKTLVLVHIPPWADADVAKASAETEFDGPIIIGTAGMQLDSDTRGVVN